MSSLVRYNSMTSSLPGCHFVRLCRLLIGTAAGTVFLLIALDRIHALAFLRSASSDDPEWLYQHRDEIDNAKQAANLWSSRSAADFDDAWKLARVCYWIGTHAPQAERRIALNRGIAAGEAAIRLAPG